MSAGSMGNGGRANRAGDRLEQFVSGILRGCDYAACPPRQKAEFFEHRAGVDGRHYLMQQMVGETIYRTTRKVDFFVINNAQFPDGLIVECKWQQSAGSVDEKYPFLVENIIGTNIPTVIVLDGGGYKPGAREWLLGRVPAVQALVGVWSMSELQRETNNGFWG